jgi:hypothetical protein
MLPPKVLKKVDQAFVLVNDEIDYNFNNEIRSFEANLQLIKTDGSRRAIQTIFLKYLDKFSKELWEKIEKIIPESSSIYEFDWEKELKDYIINHRCHEFYIIAKERIKKFEMSGTNDWYDLKYKAAIKSLDYEIGAAVETIKDKHPLTMKEKEAVTTNHFNINAPTNLQVGNHNTQQIFNAVQTIEQAIDKSDKAPEEKSKAKGMFHAALGCGGVIWEKTVAGITEAILDGSK